MLVILFDILYKAKMTKHHFELVTNKNCLQHSECYIRHQHRCLVAKIGPAESGRSRRNQTIVRGERRRYFDPKRMNVDDPNSDQDRLLSKQCFGSKDRLLYTKGCLLLLKIVCFDLKIVCFRRDRLLSSFPGSSAFDRTNR